MSDTPVIVSASRTPFGKFGGGLMSLSAVELGAHAIRTALEKAGVAPDQVDEVIMGIVLQAGVGQIPSRQAAIKAGLPVEVRSNTINKVCASGMKAVTLAAQAIRAGDGEVFVAGGMESMSNAPYLLPQARFGARMFDAKMVDAMVHDGLWCALHDVHMAVHGANVAAEFGVTREQQDEWAARSHQRAAAAIASGRFAQEIAPVTIPQKKGDPIVVKDDESVRQDTTVEKLAKLAPVFSKDGSITAGNAPGVNDGAAALVVMSQKRAEAMGLKPLARIVSVGEVGQEAPYLATVPALAIKQALGKAGLSVNDLSFIEINEAFSAVALTSTKLLEADPERVNVNGGAVALGHPIGASGARILGSLMYQLLNSKQRYGAAAICSGAAQGDAVILENLTL
jgi:acetyl-CoA C-acetyltransferase